MRRVKKEYVQSLLLSGKSREEALQIAENALSGDVIRAVSAEAAQFPTNLECKWKGLAFQAKLYNERATVRIDLPQAIEGIVGRSEKPGVFDRGDIVRSQEVLYEYELWVIFTPPEGKKPGDIREWDLPFPSGLPGTNRTH